MKDCKSVWVWTSTGYPFTVYGKRGTPGVVVEWEWGCEAVRIPMWKVIQNPDVAISVAASRVLGRR